jgi:anhydro-N-acetylmuramic acid kinase
MQDLYIGIMSGTSMDGIDTVIVNFASKTPEVLGHVYSQYPDAVKAQLLELITTKHADLEALGALHTHLGELYARDVLRILSTNNINADQIKAIGLHGQTIFHAPNHEHPFTWQLGNAHVVAATTNIPVIADFRGLDVALQGQGAPLAPLFHLALFGQLHERVAVLNLGGIANITLIEHQKILQAFDTGPANCLLDAWMLQTQNKAYDKNGAFSRSGQILPELLEQLLTEPYLQKAAPKSTGRELFNVAWLNPKLHTDYETQDVAATLTEFTAITATAPLKLMPSNELILCGGGADNRFLVERLQFHAQCLVSTSIDYGFKAEYIEPIAFAYLAKMALLEKPLHLQAITGSNKDHKSGIKYIPE